jgi:hypothetical protein
MWAAVAAGWEVVARQSPGTPLFIGMLPGPIGTLRELATTLGLLLLITSLLLGWSGRVAPAALVALLYIGALTALGAQTYAALHGMHGVQLVDFRPGVRPLFLTKHAGLALVFGALFELGRRVLSGGRGLAPVQLDSEERRH